MRAAFFFGVPTFALVPADNVFSATLVSFAVAMGLFGLLFDDFLVGFLDGFLGAFFAAVFFTAFLAVLFAVFLASFTERVPVLARFFDAAALAVRALGDLRALFAPRFLAGFFLAVATTISFIAQTRLSGIIAGGVYRVASASSPNTEKTSGFRSRLYSAVSRAARLIFSHTSANRARRGRLALALASSARKRSLTQRSTLSMKDASATRSLPPSASPSAWSSRGSTRGSVASRAAVR